MRNHIYPLLVAVLFMLSAVACQPQLNIRNETPDPGEAENNPFVVNVIATDGITGENGPSSYPKFEITIEGDEASYDIFYYIDDEDDRKEEKSVFPGETKTVSLTGDKSVREHRIYGKVVRVSTDEEVTFSSVAWLRWLPLVEVKPTYSTAALSPTAFTEKPITVDKNLIITMDVTYKDPKTFLETVTYNHSSVSVKNLRKAKDGRAQMVVVPSAQTDEGWFGMILVNGNIRDTLVQKFICTGNEAQGQTVTDFSVEGFDGTSVSVPMKETVSFVLHHEPDKAVDSGEISVVSKNTDVFKVIGSGSSWAIKPVWPGTAGMTITVGSITKEYSVTVTGSPVSDFRIGSAYSSSTWITGTQVSDLIVPVPADAFDADEIKVSSLNPDILSVSSQGGYSYALKALRYGKATIKVSTGHCSKTFDVTVNEDLDLGDFKNKAISWGESVEFTVKGHFTDFFITSTDPDITLYRSGNTVTVSNDIYKSSTANKRYGKDVLLSFKAGDGSVYSTQIKLEPITNDVRYVLSKTASASGVELTFKFKNGKDSSLSFETMYGYIMSYQGEAQNMSDFYSKMEHNFMGDLWNASGKMYGRYYDFIKTFTGERDGWIDIPAMSVKEYRLNLSVKGDDFGDYMKGVVCVMFTRRDIYSDREEIRW